MHGIITEYEGIMCVANDTRLEDEPKILRRLWRIVKTVGNPYTADRPDIGHDARYNGDGQWATSHPLDHRSTGSVSTGPGSTEAIGTQEFDVPQPRGRGPFRWHAARWEKLRKIGWVEA